MRQGDGSERLTLGESLPLTSKLTTTYGRFGLVNRTWDVLDAGRSYMVAAM
jgi:hypothetical protein